jgi:hypothetical protein
VGERRIKPADATRFAGSLDLDPDCGICYACLGIVALEVGRGDDAAVTRELRRMTPDLWAEGLEAPALAAARRAVDIGVANAEWLLGDLERKGGRSAVARAIVRDLAEKLSRRVRRELQLESLARERLAMTRPELN